uniref:beta-N-acetylhexosaminidase n=1 Tax=uncultured bacterium contig00004 TaxID=1181496 RepID=A0A806JXT9_9BACT|nr:beta-N-acetylhexosaminidase [uncultured bacterium contig00004]
MGDWLRGELGFQGIIIADDFTMAAAGQDGRSLEETVVRSISAGADMVLVWPQHIRRVHREILLALEDGRLTRDRLTDAAERVIYEKISLRLFPQELFH